MCLLGHARIFPGSELKLYQIRVAEKVRGDGAGWGEFSDGHGGFVAGVAPDTVNAVLHYLVTQGEAVGDAEVEVFEERWNAGEKAEALNAGSLGLIEEGAYQEAAGSASLRVGTDDDGADLSQMLAIDVERGTANELVGSGFDDSKGANVGADLFERAMEKGAVAGKALDQLIDSVGVVRLRSTRSQGGYPEVVFRCDEGDCE